MDQEVRPITTRGRYLLAACAAVAASAVVFLREQRALAAERAMGLFIRLEPGSGRKVRFHLRIPVGASVQASCRCLSIDQTTGEAGIVEGTVECERSVGGVVPGLFVTEPGGGRRFVPIRCP